MSLPLWYASCTVVALARLNEKSTLHEENYKVPDVTGEDIYDAVESLSRDVSVSQQFLCDPRSTMTNEQETPVLTRNV